MFHQYEKRKAMLSIKPSDVLEQLTKTTPLALNELPAAFGIYALWDHLGRIRYIGSTPKATENFRTRIGNKHVTGTEARSHKFSHVYCVGRMWRYCKKMDSIEASDEQDIQDARIAKSLRTMFIRRHCRATCLEIAADEVVGGYGKQLIALELNVQAIASREMRQWEGTKCPREDEPSDLIDEILAERPELIEPVKRQAAIYERHHLIES